MAFRGRSVFVRHHIGNNAVRLDPRAFLWERSDHEWESLVDRLCVVNKCINYAVMIEEPARQEKQK